MSQARYDPSEIEPKWQEVWEREHTWQVSNEPGADTYPIAAFSWLIVKTAYSDANKGKAIVYLLKWLVTDGQPIGASLDYAPLPTSVQALAENNLKLIKAGGTAVLS